MTDLSPMLLFDGSPMHPLNQLPFSVQKVMLARTLTQFRERPLCGGGYDEESLRFYDGVLGNLIRTRDSFLDSGMCESVDGFADFASHWEYHGDLYRIIGAAYVCDEGTEEPRLEMPEIKWHGMVASWSKSYNFTEGFNHVYPGRAYTFICANTLTSAGIDANKLSEFLGCFNPCTACENEVIFPMKRRYVTKVYKDITPVEFKKMMEDARRGGEGTTLVAL